MIPDTMPKDEPEVCCEMCGEAVDPDEAEALDGGGVVCGPCVHEETAECILAEDDMPPDTIHPADVYLDF